MLGLLKKQPTTETKVSSVSDGDDIANPLASVSVENGRYVFDSPASDTTANDNYNEETRDRTKAAIERLYSDDRFHGTLCGLLGWVGRKKGLQSLQIDKTDEDFKAASDVVYRRLMDGPMGPLLDRLSDQTIEDVIVCMAGFGPIAYACVAEVRAKSKKPLRKRNVTPENDNKGGDDVRS